MFVPPRTGRLKPIERAFKTLNPSISKHPLVAGAYTGPSPVAKPSNYGAAVCSRFDLELVVSAAIAEYNSEQWSRSVLRGRNPNQVLLGRRSPARRISQALASELIYSYKRLVACGRDGGITFMGGSYWCKGMAALVGCPASERSVSVRYDPADLSAVYCRVGKVEHKLERIETGGFDNAEAAAEAVRNRRRVNKALREAAEALGLPESELRSTARESAEAQAAEAAKARTASSPITLAPLGRKAG